MSVRVTQSMMNSQVLSGLESVTEQISKTEQELSSGLKLTQPSDNPYGVATALQFRDSLAQTKQYETNVGDAQSWQSATDTALSQINSMVQRVHDLVVQGASSTTDNTGRAAIAAEVSQLVDEIKQTGNTQYAGRYIFSGTATQTPPYNTTNDSYAGNTNGITHEIGPGVQVQINTPGVSVIGDGTSGLLQTLRTVLTDLGANNTTALGNDLTSLSTADDTIMSAQATVGALGDRLATAASRLGDMQQLTTTNLSNTEDADMAKTMTDLSTEQAVYQAALRAGAALIQPSLMDFLSTG